MSLFSFTWWKKQRSLNKVKKLPYPLSPDMRRNYDIIEKEMVAAMQRQDTLCVVYISFGDSTVEDLLQLTSIIKHYSERGIYPRLVDSFSYDVPDTLIAQSIVTVLIRW